MNTSRKLCSSMHKIQRKTT